MRFKNAKKPVFFKTTPGVCKKVVGEVVTVNRDFKTTNRDFKTPSGGFAKTFGGVKTTNGEVVKTFGGYETNVGCAFPGDCPKNCVRLSKKPC